MRLVAISILVLFSLLFSGCQVYSNLYGVPGQNQSAVFVPDSSIVVEQQNGFPTVQEEASEEAMRLAEEIQKKIDQKAAEQESDAQNPNPVESELPPEPTEPIEPQEQPQAVILQETEKVSLQPQAADPDGDVLVFAFTSPLNENGEWQTSYGDAGEYTVTVTASDGELTTTKDILVIVNKKEEPPVINSASPEQSSVSLKETESQSFVIEASDLNKDPLAYEWKLDGSIVSAGKAYDYRTTYDDSGAHTVKIEISDGSSTASRIWAVDIENVNRKPKLSQIAPINAGETDTITLAAMAEDDDSDALDYSISDERFAEEENTFTWKTDYDSAGSYTAKVSVSDGQDTVSQDVQITVANVNRKPVITGIVQKK